MLADEYVHVHNVRDFPQARLVSELNAGFLLNEHGDLYFLWHNKSAHVILFNLKDQKKLSEGKTDTAESMYNLTTTLGCKL